MAIVRVLIADDDPGTVATLELLLRGEGYMVQSAPDGTAALEKAKTMVPDILVTDLEMPGLHGNQLIAALRADERLKGMFILVLTVHGDKIDKLKALLSGADDFVVKPARAGEFVGRLEVAQRFLRLRRESREAVRRAASPDGPSTAALEALLGKIREQVAAAGRAIEAGDSQAAWNACKGALDGLDGAVRGLRGGPAAEAAGGDAAAP